MPKKEKIGKVISNKMSKTIVVLVIEKSPNRRFGKIQSKSVKFKAHDEQNSCPEGSLVRIIECRPYSKDKTWRLVSILEESREV
jgi:small subunit ribosomal protein S17